ncbi:lytic polysaccharide monooxygenase [Aaosphaeria arxii CBS 175.79]|uniref:lytic cellulose monooxygenase (C4-dehydrogenating) n=1 Tax=Aaosphaeria arxii CBS 175.79 TaxID=1450172 RepID=A0A6A5X9D4_9PLEO|nr:lytic polysaccharide monooxygenase [Aaosphaeria arxii CBS 175.79]KAF2009543.1 lytic polysaccharide monooxygenase [Aaosphaeria arxii CBS 175.79]
MAAPLVAAHGFVQNATIGGKEYDFYHPYQDPYMSPAPPRVSRKISGNGPVEDLTLIDMECGGWTAGKDAGSAPAALHAPAEAGSTVNLRWTLWPESHQGPIITYMARCPDEGCQSWTPNGTAVWFKIAEDGLHSTNPDWLKNVWAVTPLISYPNKGVDYQVPECLKPGYYLVRHEIIALHGAYNYPGAQFYPGCHQLEVTGKGTKEVKEGLVSFPGAYKETDKGVLYSQYDQLPYEIPGPKLFQC